jgi:hypothetical protein
MKQIFLQYIKGTLLIAGFSIIMNVAYGQQHIIADKDETHPEIKNQQYSAAKIFSFSASQMNGYNEIQWTAAAEQDTRKFIVEYSVDGVNYQSAGELSPLDGVYQLKHYTSDARTFLYRIRMEKKDGRFFNSSPFLLNGIDARPVKLYPTIVEGNTVNLQMYLPVHRINIISLDGKQVMQKDIGGNIGFNQLAIPVLSRGQYLITFYGNGWQSTEKFMIGGS